MKYQVLLFSLKKSRLSSAAVVIGVYHSYSGPTGLLCSFQNIKAITL